MSRVAACIIGDEILAGRTLDTNSNYLAKKCFEYGLNLAHVRVIPDHEPDIISNLRDLSSKYSLVFSSGGIGPTHDDLTYEAVSKAFDIPLVLHQPTIDKMLLYTKSKLLNSGQLRMAQLPQTEDIYVTPGLWVPLVKTKNLLILPGVPILFKKMIDNWFEVELSKLSAKKELILIPKIRKSVKTIWKESDIAEKLSALQSEALECEIAFGSYPKLFEDGSTFVIISISGPDSFSDKIFQYATKFSIFEVVYLLYKTILVSAKGLSFCSFMTKRSRVQLNEIQYHTESCETHLPEISSDGDDISKFNERVKLFDYKLSHSSKIAKIDPIGISNSGGTIQAIELYNFMCHEHLKVELKDNINFIVGNNGSGKSAILTALTVCLGARASITQRATSLESLIKEGSYESRVMVTLSNNGTLRYKYDLYGDSILIERRFRRNGPNSFKIKSGISGRTISEKRDEVVSICDNYNIQVDNPLSVLTQETAKKFLVNSTAHDLYEFFMRATQLEQLSFDYAYSLDRMKSMQNSLISAKKAWPALEEKIENLKGELKLISEQKQLSTKIDELKAEILWANIIQYEADAVRKEKRISECTDEISLNTEHMEVLNQKLSETKASISSIDSTIVDLHKGKKPLIEHISILERNIVKTRGDLNDNEKIQRKINDDVTRTKLDLASIEKKIEECANDANSDRLQKSEEISRLEGLILESNRNYKKISDQILQNSSAVEELDATLDSAQQVFSIEKKIKEDLTKELDKAQNGVREKIKQFGENLPEAMLQIKANSLKFVHPPIGPIGMHVELKDMSWSVPMDATIGQYMRNFITRDHNDQKLLESILKSCNCSNPIINLSPKSIDISSGEPDQKFLSALRVLKIDNEYVMKALVIFTNIEKIVLISDRIEARETMLARPKNIEAVFTHSHRISATQNSVSFNAFLSKKQGGNPFESCEARARYISEQLKDSTHRFNIASRDLERIKSSLSNHREIEYDLNDKLNNIKNRTSTIKSEIRELEEQLNFYDNTGIDVFIGEKECILGKLTSLKSQFGDSFENKIELDEKIKELSEKVAEAKEDISSLDKHIKLNNDTLCELSQKKRDIQCEIERTNLNIVSISAQISDLNNSLTFVKDSISKLSMEASKFSDRILTERSIQSIERDIAQFEELINDKKDFCLDDFETTKKEFDECVAECDKSKINVRINEDILDDMKIALEKRQRQWEDLRNGIAKRSNQDFIACLQARDYRGFLEYDHKTRELNINVHIDNIEQSDKLSKRDIKQLSGGEKSFGTTCFLLSLWDAMGCPIRCLDEFDVYMDAINRRLVVEMLINNAKNSGTQFILITPLSVRNFLAPEDQDSVHMVVLKDPHRSG